MAERLALALSWNRAVSELQIALAAQTRGAAVPTDD